MSVPGGAEFSGVRTALGVVPGGSDKVRRLKSRGSICSSPLGKAVAGVLGDPPELGGLLVIPAGKLGVGSPFSIFCGVCGVTSPASLDSEVISCL